MYYMDLVKLDKISPTIRDISDAGRKIVSVLNCDNDYNYLIIYTDRPDVE